MTIQAGSHFGWTRAEARPDDPEAGYELNARIQARVDEARDEAAAAREAQAAGSEIVTRLRGDAQIGMASRNSWLKASRELARLQEQSANADAKVAAVDRWQLREREEWELAVRRQQRAIEQEATERRRDLAHRYGEAIGAFLTEVVEPLEAEVAELNQAYRRRIGEGPVMTSPIADVRDLLERQARNLSEGAVK